MSVVNKVANKLVCYDMIVMVICFCNNVADSFMAVTKCNRILVIELKYSQFGLRWCAIAEFSCGV